MNTTYQLQNIVTSPRGAVTADLVENGVVIATTRRPAKSHGCVLPFATKFLGERAKSRFVSYCDSLSVAEVVETFYLNAR